MSQIAPFIDVVGRMLTLELQVFIDVKKNKQTIFATNPTGNISETP